MYYKFFPQKHSALDIGFCIGLVLRNVYIYLNDVDNMFN